jgi:hypothetical protein
MFIVLASLMMIINRSSSDDCDMFIIKATPLLLDETTNVSFYTTTMVEGGDVQPLDINVPF